MIGGPHFQKLFGDRNSCRRHIVLHILQQLSFLELCDLYLENNTPSGHRCHVQVLATTHGGVA